MKLPKMGLRESFEMETRNKYTKVNCELSISIDGRELPSMAVVGEALEQAGKMIEDAVKKSYEVVPPRDVDQTNVTQLPGAIPEPVKPAQPTVVEEPYVPTAPARPSTSAFD